MMSIGTPLMWSLFAAFVLVALVVDFFAMEKQARTKSP
jgi:tellurite resistance protein TerC